VAELEDVAREIEARRTGVHVINETEWADLQESLCQADRRNSFPMKSLSSRTSATEYEGPLHEACLRRSRKNL
jgi:hypothetical protein